MKLEIILSKSQSTTHTKWGLIVNDLNIKMSINFRRIDRLCSESSHSMSMPTQPRATRNKQPVVEQVGFIVFWDEGEHTSWKTVRCLRVLKRTHYRVCVLIRFSPVWLWPYGLQLTRLLCLRDSPGRTTGVGCHALLRESSWPRDRTHVSYVFYLDRWVLTTSTTWEAKIGFNEVKSLSRVRLFTTSWTVPYHAPPSMEFSRQEYWNGLPFPSSEDLPDPGIEPKSPTL